MEKLESEPLLSSRRVETGNYRDGSTVNAAPGAYLDRFSGAGSLSRSTTPSTDSDFVIDETTLLQACVFLEDATQYHDIDHRVNEKSLKLYRFYYTPWMKWLRAGVILVLHLLAFVEWPSSLSLTADIRKHPHRLQPPCGVTEAVEVLCLIILLTDLCIKSYLKGREQFLKSKWLMAYVFVLSVSFVDWFVTLGYGCREVIRIRRLLRPFFILQNSSLMKKTVNSLRRTLPEVFGVLVMLALHIYFFALFGMLLFPSGKGGAKRFNNTQGGFGDELEADSEKGVYFPTLQESVLNLLVLITTANNPDVTMPAYNRNRFYAIYFIVFLVIGLYCFMNMLTAIIYNQFRGYFLNSMQTSLFRRRLATRAAFEVLRRRRFSMQYNSSLRPASMGVPVRIIRQVVERASIKSGPREAILQELDQYYAANTFTSEMFQDLFRLLDLEKRRRPRPAMRSQVGYTCGRIIQQLMAHRYFTYFGSFIAAVNVIVITCELITEFGNDFAPKRSMLEVVNLVFIVYYLLEQCLRVWAMGWRLYVWDRGNIFDGFITILLVIVEGLFLVCYGLPTEGKLVEETFLWDLVRIINMLIMIRLLRVVPQIKSLGILASTIMDLIRNLRPFAGVLVVMYYIFAILGLQLFEGKIKYSPANGTNTSQQKYPCGTYNQLAYWSNNFDDFGAALVVLWDIMVVNNWHVFLHEYSKVATSWSLIYFIVWWLVSVVISLNVFTALILENFIMRWDRVQQQRRERTASGLEDTLAVSISVHDLFRGMLKEPAEAELLNELKHHSYLKFEPHR